LLQGTHDGTPTHVGDLMNVFLIAYAHGTARSAKAAQDIVDATAAAERAA
jgi:hypothetical protein